MDRDATLVDVTDDEYYSRCAKCGLDQIHDSHQQCPECNNMLGRSNCYSQAAAIIPDGHGSSITDSNAEFRASQQPVKSTEMCYIVFECRVEQKLGCNLYGDGPVAVESLMDCPLRMGQGIVKYSQGHYATLLLRRARFPSVGDVLVAVGDVEVEHLSAVEVSRTCEHKTSFSQFTGLKTDQAEAE